MDGDAQKNDLDGQCMSILSSGKWLQIVKNSSKVLFSRGIRILDSKIPRHLVSLDAKIDPLSNHASDERWKHNGVEEGLVSCHEVSTSPSHVLSKKGGNLWSYQSEKMHKKVIALTSKTFSAPSTNISQGTLEVDMRSNIFPRFVFKLENQKDSYVASLSSDVKDQSLYMIHLERGDSSSHLVGRIKVSTLFSGSSFTERKFVLFSNINDDHPLPHGKKNRGLVSKKVVKNTQTMSRLRCSWDDDQQYQEPSFEKDFATNLERLALVVKQEFIQEETGGWGMKFLKKSSQLVQTERGSISMDVVMPSGIHGGPEDGPLSLIERWKSQGKCDCGGWDLGCSLTLLKGQCDNNNNNNNHIFDLYLEGSSKYKTHGLRIVNVREGLYLVQFQTKISVLQSFSIALAFLHSQSKKLL